MELVAVSRGAPVAGVRLRNCTLLRLLLIVGYDQLLTVYDLYYLFIVKDVIINLCLTTVCLSIDGDGPWDWRFLLCK